ncbi:MAG: YceI family protein [Algicola sp.]|nr:YceI family protein [Algicola sp.]
MAQLKFIRVLVAVVLFGLVMPLDLVAQNFTVDNQKSTLKVLGTSSLHDWEINAEKQSGSLQIEAGDMLTIQTLKMTFDVNALKSGKSAMDKNTRNALNYDDYKTITFNFSKLKSSKKEGNFYNVVVVGDLTIAGSKKAIELPLRLEKSNGVVTLTGKKALKMTTFNIEPPTALLGSIKTGDDITIKFNTVFN